MPRTISTRPQMASICPPSKGHAGNRQHQHAEQNQRKPPLPFLPARPPWTRWQRHEPPTITPTLTTSQETLRRIEVDSPGETQPNHQHAEQQKITSTMNWGGAAA